MTKNKWSYCLKENSEKGEILATENLNCKVPFNSCGIYVVGSEKYELEKDHIIRLQRDLIAQQQVIIEKLSAAAYNHTTRNVKAGSWWTVRLRESKLNTQRNRKCISIIAAILLLLISAIVTYVILANLHKEEERSNGEYLGKHRIYTRGDWGGNPPKYYEMLPHPTDYVIISHSATDPCFSFQTCSSRVRSFQNTHVANNSPDVGYNFIIGGDSNIYVGRGWDVRNFHMANSIGINFVGDFNLDQLTDGMIQAAQLLIQQGVDLGKLNGTYILVGHNQTSASVPMSPGENAYRVIKEWPNFSDVILFGTSL